jgi:hypothetical protein
MSLPEAAADDNFAKAASQVLALTDEPQRSTTCRLSGG